MSNVTNKQIILEHLNDEAARALLPTMIYVAVLLILGALGNSCVIFYYRFRAKYTPHSYFILVLAVFDFCLCALCMPMEIMELRSFFMAYDGMLCKMHHFFNYAFSLSSLFVLLSIAIERYRGICQPFKPKMTRTKAQIACVLCFFLGVLLSSPMIFIHSIIRVNVTLSSQYDVEVRYCVMTKENSFRILFWIINYGYLLGFFCISSAIITLYSLIGRRILKQSKFRKQVHEGLQMKNIDPPRHVSNRCIGDLNIEYVKDGERDISWIQMNSDSKFQSEETNTSTNRRVGYYKKYTELERQEPRSHVRNSSNAYEEKSNETSFPQNPNSHGNTENKIDEYRLESNLKYKNGESLRSVEILKQTRFRTRSGTSNLQPRKFTLSLLLVSAAFILSYVPFVCLILWRITVDDSVLTNMLDAALVFYCIGLRSYLINSAINPVVFGACNNQFRAFFIASLCNNCRKSN